MYTCKCVYLSIYIYIERERDPAGDRRKGANKIWGGKRDRF